MKEIARAVHRSMTPVLRRRTAVTWLLSAGVVAFKNRDIPAHAFGTRSVIASALFSQFRASSSEGDRPPRKASFGRQHANNMKSADSDGNVATASGEHQNCPVEPVVTRRDEDRVVYFGVAPPGWDSSIPRQAETSTEALLDPPVSIPDPYGWLRDDSRTNPEVLDHLKRENAYTESMTQHLQGLRETLYQEMLSSIQETDYSVPRPRGDLYFYYKRTFEGKPYPVHCRSSQSVSASSSLPSLLSKWDGSIEAPILPQEEVILDENALGEGKGYCSVGAARVSPSQQLLAYTVDFTGKEICQLFVKDLTTGAIVDHDPSLEIYGNVLWGKDDSTLFYLKLDAMQRPYQVCRRRRQQQNTSDDDVEELLFEETDDSFFVSASKSLDGKYIFISTGSKETSEVHYLDLEDEHATLQCIAKRHKKVLYQVEHRKGQWWIISNVEGTPNMRLFTSPVKAHCQESWQVVKSAADPDQGSPQVVFDGGYEHSLHEVTVFSNHVVVEGRRGGLPRIWVLSLNDDDDNEAIVKKCQELTFPESAFDAGLGTHYEFDTDKIMVCYDSLVTPPQDIEVNLESPNSSDDRLVIKQKFVPGYKQDEYDCDRITVLSRDGQTEIPVSLVYRKDVMEKHRASKEAMPTLLYGYGSYESCEEAYFSARRLTLLNRGMVYVIAHIRGGGEMGRQWYEEPNGAKLLCKKNTFNDFVDVARYLIDERQWTSAKKLACSGRSAGGMLIGAVLNQSPELFQCALMDVPFVDIMVTMVDASIPLTAGEWDEWGNPSEVKFFEYMKSYSPMNNVRKVKYPACLMLGGLHDSRVAFWEPAKFAAELRHSQAPDSGVVCLRTDMSSGHSTGSDRYKYLRQIAFENSFLLDHLGLANEAAEQKEK